MAAKRTRATALKAMKEQIAMCVDDVALLIETDRKTLYDDVKAGKVPHFNVGRLIRIPTIWVRRACGIQK